MDLDLNETDWYLVSDYLDTEHLAPLKWLNYSMFQGSCSFSGILPRIVWVEKVLGHIGLTEFDVLLSLIREFGLDLSTPSSNWYELSPLSAILLCHPAMINLLLENQCVSHHQVHKSGNKEPYFMISHNLSHRKEG